MAFALLAILAVAALMPAQAEEAIEIPADCGQALCVVPKPVWAAILTAHNRNVDEVRRLRAELAARDGGGAPKPVPCIPGGRGA